MSEIGEEGVNQTVKVMFQNKDLTGYDLANNNQIVDVVKRDSTGFANQIIHHERGTQIICQLIDTALRPQILIKYLQDQKNKNILQNKQLTASSPNQTTTIIYNAVQILTNQYEDFVQYIFEEQKSQQKCLDGLQNKDELNNQGSVAKEQEENKVEKTQMYPQQVQNLDDCVIMDLNYFELKKNQQDSMLKKFNDLSKLNQSQFLKCSVLDRMFLLFDQPVPIEETPVSYFNKIILQFVYQKPQEIMRFFYCDEIKINKKSSQCQKIKKIAQHLYNNSVVELIVHIMGLQNEGNFFVEQKIEMLGAVVEQVFRFEQAVKEQNINNQADIVSEASKISQLMKQKVQNYVLILKSLYEKLQDRYEQQKYMLIFKQHLNSQKLLQKIINYFFLHCSFFQMSGLLLLLIQTLKMDQLNFQLHKIQTQNANPPSRNRKFSFQSKNEESSLILSYDLKLSKQILDQIQEVITKLSAKYQQWEGSTARIIEYYELVHSWLNVTIKDRQHFARTALMTPRFINQCLFNIKNHQKSTILHNSVRNILVDFLPKMSQSIKIVLSPQCQLLSFIQDNLQPLEGKERKNKKKCYQNQLYHIGKAVLSSWEQQNMVDETPRTKENQEDECQRMPTQQPNLPPTNEINTPRFKNLKRILSKKLQFYEHPICSDPRESSSKFKASSFKNYVKPILSDYFVSEDNVPTPKLQSNSRQGECDSQNKDGGQQLNQIEDLMREQNLKDNVMFKNLKLGEVKGNNVSQSVISPMNANYSHTFNFDFDALPLDSDNSDYVQSLQEDLPVGCGDGLGNINEEDQIKLMQENLQNLHIVPGDVLGVLPNVLSPNGAIVNQRNILTCDNYRREQLSKSMDLQNVYIGDIQRVESISAIQQSPGKPSEEDVLSLGFGSKQSNSKISLQNKDSNLQISQEPLGTLQPNDKASDTVDSNFVRIYSSYIKYDINTVYMEVEQM